MSELDNFYLKLEEPNKSCVLELRNTILKQDGKVTETKKYGMPCFCFNNKMFCYLWIDKKTNYPYILFVEGNYLVHEKLDYGNRNRMKMLSINPNIDLPMDLINELLRSAINLYISGAIKTN